MLFSYSNTALLNYVIITISLSVIIIIIYLSFKTQVLKFNNSEYMSLMPFIADSQDAEWQHRVQQVVSHRHK